MKKKQVFIRLPMWKAYLYSLYSRYKLYQKMNSGVYHIGLCSSHALFNSMLQKYVRREVWRQPKAFVYDELVEQVLIKRVAFASKKEMDIATKLLIVRKVNPKELIMELKEIKVFAKEVGLGLKEIKGLSIDDLIVKVITSVDQKAQYSEEFVAFYDALDDKYFDRAEGIGTKEEASSSDASDIDTDELLEAIGEAKKKNELLEIFEDEDLSVVFGDLDVSEMRLPTQIRKAMKEAIEAYAEGAGEGAEGADELDDETVKELVEAINAAESAEELKEFVAENELEELFGDIAFKNGKKGRASKWLDVEEVQTAMLAALGVEDVEAGEEAGTDIDEAYAAYEAMELKELKAAAKADFGIKVKLGMKADELLEAIGEALQEAAEAEGEAEGDVGVTADVIDAAEEAEDKDTLLEICEALDIELKPLQKRSVKAMAKLCREALECTSGKQEEVAGEDTSADEAERILIYDEVIECVAEGGDAKDVAKIITPFYKGKKSLWLNKRAKQWIAFVSVDLD